MPGSNCIIDHLVIGPAGVFAVDSERWDRRLPVRATQGGQLFHGPYSQTGRLKHAQLEAGEAARLISAELGRTVRVRPAMVIYGPTVPWTVARISGVDVFSGRRLRRYLRAQARASRAQRLERPDMERIRAAAERTLPRRSGRRRQARRGRRGAGPAAFGPPGAAESGCSGGPAISPASGVTRRRGRAPPVR